MRVKEIDRRIMLEFIEHKYQQIKSKKIRVDENDLNYYSGEITEILLSLEKTTNGKIKLISVTPKNDKPMGYDESDEAMEEKLFALKKKYPDYYFINYNPSQNKENFTDKDIKNISTTSGNLYVNTNTGLVKLNKVENNFNPSSKEFRIISILINNKDYQASYKELLGEEHKKTDKRALGFIIRDVKKDLGILPEKEAKNKDIIKNIKNYGYKIII